jgi:hypothetical protein
VSDAVPRLEVSTRQLDFGRVSPGESSALELTVSNTGTAPLALQSVAVGDDTWPDYTVAWDVRDARCASESGTTLVLEAGCALPVTVTYTATTPGGLSNALVLTTGPDSADALADPLHAYDVVWLTGETDGEFPGESPYLAGGAVRFSQTAVGVGEVFEAEVLPVHAAGSAPSVLWSSDGGAAFDDDTAALTEVAATDLGLINAYAVLSDDAGQAWAFARVAVLPAEDLPCE